MSAQEDSGSASGTTTLSPLVYAVVAVTGALLQLLQAARRVYPPDEDPIYYRLTAEALARGRGFVADVSFMWVSAPDSAKGHPSHDHWQPLTSLMIAPFVTLSDALWVAVIPNALLTGILAAVLLSLGHRALDSSALAIAAVLLLLADPTASRYFSSVESIPSYLLLLLGAAIAYSKSENTQPFRLWPVLLGTFSALAALSRSDAMTLFGLAGGLTFVLGKALRMTVPTLRTLASSAAVFTVLMAPWWLRNLRTFGTPLSPASRVAPWLLHWYDVLIYEPTDWKARYLAHAALDPGAVLSAKLGAFWFELLQIIGGPAGLALSPIVFLGVADLLRRRSSALTFLATFSLALAGTYGLLMEWGPEVGGGYRSRVATLPLAILGLLAGGRFVAEVLLRRLVPAPRLQLGFEGLTLAAALALLGVRVDEITSAPIEGLGTRKIFDAVDAALNDAGVPNDATVITNEPLRVGYSTGRPTLVIPNDGNDALCKVARRYETRWLVLFPFGWHFERYASESVKALATHPHEGPDFQTITWTSWFHLIELGCGRTDQEK
ncbi:MAG: hypothetical protein HY791_32840 [Deltaproteobacteria bacterium]|nr:hypothetical protein [Deltaproteobacteria bacterium]